MPHWLIKSGIQRAISLLPYSYWWNEQLQNRVSKSLELGSGRFEQRLQYCERHWKNFAAVKPQASEGLAVFELGTGWHAVIPTALFLCGAAEVRTVDIVPVLTPARIKETLRMFCRYDELGTLKNFLPRAKPERMARLKKAFEAVGEKDPKVVLEEMNIRVMVRDAQNTGLAPGSIDLFISNAVLEHIPRPVLANMLAEFQRIGRPKAVLSHFINLSDQYAVFDRSISKFNFLKYSDRHWEWLDSPLTRKSRMRISDYRQVFAESGCPILREENVTGPLSELEQIRLAPRFQRYSQADLLVLETWIVAQFSR